MKNLFVNYFKLLKSGFLHKPYYSSLLLILASVMDTLGIKSLIVEMCLIYLGCWGIFALVMNEISENKYILITTLPIKTTDVLKIVYLHTYIIIILGFVGTLLAAIFTHQQLPMLYLITIALFLPFTNVFYPYFASIEFKLGLNQPSKGAVWFILVIPVTTFISIFPNIVNLVDRLHFFSNHLGATIALIFVTALLTLKMSYQSTLKRVMGF